MCVEDLEQKKICHQCIGDAYLSSEIEKVGEQCECDYCGDDEENAISLVEVADRVEEVFENHFERTPAEPNWYEEQLLKDREIDFSWWREGQQTVEAIEEVASVSSDVAVDLQKILNDRHTRSYDEHWEEAEFDSDAHYWEKPADYSDIWEQWQRFELELKTKTRYFNAHAAEFLKMIFEGLDGLRTRDGRSLIVEAGPDTELPAFYRARHFETEDALKRAMKAPDQELAPPPAKFATAGRMNSRGVAAFYGANLPTAALAEVRPPVGSQVLIAKFKLLRNLKLLDLNSLTQIGIAGSYFDPGFFPLLKRTKFLSDLAMLMSKPVLPSDADVEYLPTQVISDYLSSSAGTHLDGILFPSVQTDVREEDETESSKFLNVVLFNRSSRVAKMVYPENTEIDVDTWQMYNEGPEREYRVRVEIPSTKNLEDNAQEVDKAKTVFELALEMEDVSVDADERVETLEVDSDSLSVHVVRGVRILTDPYTVDWSQWTNNAIETF